MIVKSEIISLLNDVLNQPARLRKGGNELVYFCPFCHHHKAKMEICLEEGDDFSKWHCWVCNQGGHFLGSLLKKINASSYYRERLFKLTGDIRLAKHQYTDQDSSTIRLPEEFHPLSVSKKTPEYKNALVYLIRRGLLREDILRYNIGYCENGPYEYHIIIPSYDAKGMLNFFIGRRYYDTPGVIPHKKPKVSMDIVGFESFVNYNEPLNLCEGAFDAFAVRNNAIPLFGKYPSKKLRESMIINGTTRVNMVLDNDAMEDSINNCKMMMRLGIDVYLVHLDGKDPSVLGFEKIHRLIKEAEQFTESDLLKYKLEL